jgi:N-acetylneuraminic acid mutarotase
MKQLDGYKSGLMLIGLIISGFLSTAAVCPAAEDTWTTKADMTTARNVLSTCVVDGKLYAIGGALNQTTSSRAVAEYDPATNKWTQRANLPETTCGLSTSVIDGKIYTIGGATSAVGVARSSVYVYDPETDTWIRKTDMPTARAYLSASVVNGKIYVIGGAPSVFSPAYRTVEEYDPAADTWTRKADMPTARSTHSTGVVDGKIYVIGGMVGSPTPWTGLSVVEVYDPATDIWTRKADMPTRRLCHAVSAVDGKIYLMGGSTSNSGALATLEEYDPITDTWTRKADMPTARWGLSSSVVDGKIYAVGGALASNVAVPTVEEYDIGLGIRSPDFNGDGKVDIEDLILLIEHWDTDEPLCDVAPPPFGDGIVDRSDLEILMSYWGQEIEDPTLIAHWKLDETEGAIAYDSAGENDADVFGDAVWQPEGGIIDGAIELDGTDDYISTLFIINPYEENFSIFAWIKGGIPGQVIISQQNGANWLSADQSEGNLMTELKCENRSGTMLASQTVITDSDWHRIGLTWDGTNRILYVDDMEVTSDTQSNVEGSEDGLYIGVGKNLEPGSFWSGLIDDVRVYNRAVTP